MSFDPMILMPMINSAAIVTHTGTTAKTAVLTLPIKAGNMGPNDCYICLIMWSVTNNANLKTVDVDFGATNILNIAASSQSGQQVMIMVQNRNSLSSQLSNQLVVSALYGSSGNPLVTLTENTGNDLNLVISATLASAADSFSIENATPYIWKNN